MTEQSKISKAAKFTRSMFLEPYNKNKPTLTDKAAAFVTDLFQPDLDPEQRLQSINATKPWVKGGFVVSSLFDGRWLLAALPFLSFLCRDRRNAGTAYKDTMAGRTPRDLDWDKLDRDWSNK